MRRVRSQRSEVSKSTALSCFFFALGALLFPLSVPVEAQQTKYRIGVLFPGGPLYETVDGLRAGLRELGMDDGKQITLAIVDTKGDAKVAEAAARNFEREKVHLLYAVGSTVIVAAKQATANCPIVFSIGSDPVALGLIKDFVKPGGRLTGVHYLVKELTAKRLELFRHKFVGARVLVDQGFDAGGTVGHFHGIHN